MLPIILGALAVLALTSDEKPPEVPGPKPTSKRKKYSKDFILSAGKWLKENKPPEDWEGSKLEYALEEMPFEGEVYE